MQQGAAVAATLPKTLELTARSGRRVDVDLTLSSAGWYELSAELRSSNGELRAVHEVRIEVISVGGGAVVNLAGSGDDRRAPEVMVLLVTPSPGSTETSIAQQLPVAAHGLTIRAPRAVAGGQLELAFGAPWPIAACEQLLEQRFAAGR